MKYLSVILLLIATPAFSQLNADFTVTNTTGCTPFNAQFKDKSTGSPTSWFWDFGDGQTSTLQNPLITYTKSGNYLVRLIVKTATEQDYEEKDNYIHVFTTPDVKFSILAGDSGCVNLKTSFQDLSDLHDASVKSWVWSFGDSGTSLLQNPSHIYTTEGQYTVGLTIETTQGCSATDTVSGAVKAGNKPDPSFSVTPNDGCASELRVFKNTTETASAYYWDFGDNETSFDRSPQHHYGDTGMFSVKLLVSEYGCIDSAKTKDSIHVKGAAASIGIIINCDDRYKVNFKDNSVQGTSRFWHFGDGATSTAKALTHIFKAPGIYPIQLDVTGAVCNDTAYDTLHIRVTKPKITILPTQNTYCRNDSLTLIVTDLDTVITRTLAWSSGDGYTSIFKRNNDTISYVYRKNGTFTPAVYIKDYRPCIDTNYYDHPITINGPFADFKRDAIGCTNSNIRFQDASIAGNVPISSWFWSYGDGSTSTSSEPPSYKYPFPVVYNAQLAVTDITNCADTITRTVEISDTPVVDAGIDVFACANNNFTLNPTGAVSYAWLANPDLSCTNCTNPIATPTQSTAYYVTGTNDKGCSASDSINVKVQTKEFITAQPNSYSICKGDSVALNIKGADKYSWSPANTLSNTITQNPIAFPSSNTTYTVTGKDSNNCFSDVAVININVNAKPTVNIIDSTVQIIKGETFNIIASASSDVRSFAWLPLSGLSCYNCLEPVATIYKTTRYTLIATNQYNCSDSDHIIINTICTSESVFLPNTFSPNNDGMNDYFFPRSTSDLNIQSLIIFNRWGQVVYQKRNFSSNNQLNGWNGRYKNALQKPDVYIYVMELKCEKNLYVKRGNVSLVR
ncbi:MAG: PKD domain-containing protein [Parafilimonas sp.]